MLTGLDPKVAHKGILRRIIWVCKACPGWCLPLLYASLSCFFSNWHWFDYERGFQFNTLSCFASAGHAGVSWFFPPCVSYLFLLPFILLSAFLILPLSNFKLWSLRLAPSTHCPHAIILDHCYGTNSRRKKKKPTPPSPPDYVALGAERGGDERKRSVEERFGSNFRHDGPFLFLLIFSLVSDRLLDSPILKASLLSGEKGTVTLWSLACNCEATEPSPLPFIHYVL